MADPVDPTKKSVVYRLPRIDQVRVSKDLIYKTVNGIDLKLDVYYPAEHIKGVKRPAVLYVHGDAPWEAAQHAKEWGQYAGWGSLTAASGLIAVTFNHRSSEGLTKVREVSTDLDALIGYVQNHADELDINRDKLGLWACSAGVPYGLRAAFSHADFIRCIVAYYGFMNLLHLRPHLSAEVPDDDLREFSGLWHLNRVVGKHAPLLVAKAGLDGALLNASIDQYIAEATRLDAPVTYFEHNTGQHGFDVFDDDETSRAIIRETLAFLHKHLSGV